ncbi:amidase [Solimonas flava]|uniref:amidase n=1 Tax=Solimonas flava TaxID=415849 RepID=UPI000422F776|nr:amidase family protein [Solimonas flava]
MNAHRKPKPARKSFIGALALTALALGAARNAQAATFQLETAGVQEIQAAVDAGALSYEKLVQLYLARIAAYDKKGPGLNAVITLNAKALETARALDAERKTKGLRSPLMGIPVLAKDNYDTADMPTSGGDFLLAESLPYADAPTIKQLRDAGAIILAKVNMDEFAHGGVGFSSRLGQTRNPHDPRRIPNGSSGGTGAGLAAWFAPLGLGSDTGGSIRGPSFANGVVGIKPTNGLVSRTGIMPCVLSFDTGGPMARTVYDAALALGFLTGVDPKDPLTSTSAGLYFRDYTPFLKKDALKGARLGVIRDLSGTDAEVDRVFNASLEELKKLGAVIVDDLHYPEMALARTAVSTPIRDEVKDNYVAYLGTLRPGFPKTVTELADLGLKLTKAQGEFHPHPSVFKRFKALGETPPTTSLAYTSAKQYGMKAVQGAVLGLIEQHQLDALVYPTRPKRPELIDPKTPEIVDRPKAPSLTNIANVTQFPDVIVPAGVTSDRLPVTISFFGPAYSEPRLLGYAYSYEQATRHRVSPATTPALPGEVFEY